MARSWVKLDCHWYEDPDVEAAAEIAAGDDAGAVVIALYPVLLSMAKAQNDGGRVEFSWRSLSAESHRGPTIDAVIDDLAAEEGEGA